MGRYKDGMYWRDEQNEDMRIIFTADKHSREWRDAYHRVLPRLQRMAMSILRRYYGYNPKYKSEDVVTLAINDMILNGTYDPDKPNMYSYCGTVIKRNIFNTIIYPKERSGKLLDTRWDDNVDLSERYDIHDSKSSEPDFEYFDEPDHTYDGILNYVDTHIEKLEGVIDRRDDEVQGDSKEMHLVFLKSSREYFEEYYPQVGLQSLADYVYTNTSLSEHRLEIAMRKYFGGVSSPTRKDRREVVDYLKLHEITYIQDDYSPNNGKANMSKRRAKKRNPYDYY